MNDIQSIVVKGLDGNAILLNQTYESKCGCRVLRIKKAKSVLNSRGVRRIVCSDLKSKLMSNHT